MLLCQVTALSSAFDLIVTAVCHVPWTNGTAGAGIAVAFRKWVAAMQITSIASNATFLTSQAPPSFWRVMRA